MKRDDWTFFWGSFNTFIPLFLVSVVLPLALLAGGVFLIARWK